MLLYGGVCDMSMVLNSLEIKRPEGCPQDTFDAPKPTFGTVIIYPSVLMKMGYFPGTATTVPEVQLSGRAGVCLLPGSCSPSADLHDLDSRTGQKVQGVKRIVGAE